MNWDAAIEAFASYLEVERAYSPKTVEVYLRDVRALRDHLRGKRGGDAPLARLSALDVRGVIAGNPAAAIRGPKKPRPLPRGLDVDDAFRLVEAPGQTQRTSHRRLS